jgi:hypothetical protein
MSTLVIGAAVPIPTLPFVVSKSKTLVVPPALVKLNAVAVSVDGAKIVEPALFVEAVHLWVESYPTVSCGLVVEMKDAAPMVTVPVAVRFVKLPVEGVVAPIGVLSIAPPVIVAPDEAKLFAVVAPVKVFVPVPLCVYPPVVMIPVTATIAPDEFTWNWDELPTESKELGDVVPMPKLPEFNIVTTGVAPAPVTICVGPVPLFPKNKVFGNPLPELPYWNEAAGFPVLSYKPNPE